MAVSVPMVPGALGEKPAPNEVATRVAGQPGRCMRARECHETTNFLTSFHRRPTITYISHPSIGGFMQDRRDDHRIPLRMFLNEYVRDRHHRAVTTNVSPTGLFVHRVFSAGQKRLAFGRQDRYVQLE